MESKEKQLEVSKGCLIAHNQELEMIRDLIKDASSSDIVNKAKVEEFKILQTIDEENKTIIRLQTEIAKEEVDIIKPYLKSKGIDLDIHSPEDSSTYLVERKGDKICLSYYNCHVKSKVDSLDLTQFESVSGTIVYDINGNVLIDRIVDDRGMSLARDDGKEEYRTATPGRFFIDDNHILIKRNSNDCSLVSYHLYKLEDNKYRLVHVFSKKDDVINTESFECTPAMLNNGVVAYSGKLYSIKEERYLNTLQFEMICAYDSTGHIGPYSYNNNGPHKGLKDSMSETIKEELKDGNLLYAQRTVFSHYIDRTKKGNPQTLIKTPIFVLLDMNGNIVSDLFFELKDEIRRIKVDNSTFIKVIEKVDKEVLEAKEREEKIKRHLYYRQKAMAVKREEEMISFLKDLNNTDKYPDKTMVYSSKTSRNTTKKND